MNNKMIMMIGDTGSDRPSVIFPIGGDKFTASETAVYLASHLKDGLTVKLDGPDVRLVLDSGRGATGENSGEGWGKS